MHLSSALVASALALGAAAADNNYLGFNSGATKADGTPKVEKDWEQEFETAANLERAPGVFNSVRLYTNIQATTQDDPIEAFQAAISTKTNILLGVWASGTTDINKEISALKKAVDANGALFTNRVIGISIGSEDLYRESQTGKTNDAGIGASPNTIVQFISDFKKAFVDTALENIPVGHVDTWDSWTNGSNKAVVDAVDWVGVDEYPYYENGKGNDIKNSGHLFDTAYDATIAAVSGKPVWVTETGWPTTGPNWDQAVPSVDNAKYYWQEVGCRRLFGKTPTFWYTLRDSNPGNKMKFAITDNLSTKPYFDLTCPTTFDTKPESSTTSSGPTSTGASQPSSTGGSGGSGGSVGPVLVAMVEMAAPAAPPAPLTRLPLPRAALPLLSSSPLLSWLWLPLSASRLCSKSSFVGCSQAPRVGSTSTHVSFSYLA